jgi:hypothetical protein
MASDRISRRLPDGRETRSADRYVREWRRIGVPAARALGGRLMAMDPDIVIDVGNPSPVYLPISVALRIGELWRSARGGR